MSLIELIEGMQHTQLFKPDGGHASDNFYRCLLKDALPSHDTQVRIDYERMIHHSRTCGVNDQFTVDRLCDCGKDERERKNAEGMAK